MYNIFLLHALPNSSSIYLHAKEAITHDKRNHGIVYTLANLNLVTKHRGFSTCEDYKFIAQL